ncbi:MULTISPECIES: tRNA lysidine(34) synthetase TilS [Tatumella]|uniref:tRNA(Ile)-lysidine synthase n=1 Tax=Tatumella punctata TaxID=399969 RepID=A0ABW1VRN3_9GAMM|nr:MULTISPECIES: tRNA lysidine(34) synthetase TilS [unclassified Tatumella]MBS0856079.1 tRNA lysidine(34) synthetase TilS [Tatumella sp. JGM16]MBS0877510.1 tRNA lysidine(34) synthetase TilS [Tatumella sp. JGM82]MBS0890948.1 tRNA lysidine(34) synthetase TilS [Tatumella sp. JGM94]MBS0894139.1 tRNA lysidine(34) synthetase TilS [Tatumella sp. JGM130]MBS0901962.1 tRNA lysidine(34) synthetase TilS [Tatumella sp. JGM100]
MNQSTVFSGDIPLFGFKDLLVAFSGGLDSAVLLHAVAGLRHQQNIRVRAVHIHHGLSHYADDWVTHCRQFCRSLDIPLRVEYVQLDTRALGTEASARQARYGVFSRLLNPGEALLTAHHQDDQCETLLLALKRGSGPAGLAAMPAVMPFSCGSILRPLLSCSRRQLAGYAEQHDLRWIEDDSNDDPAYDRNFLRLEILPLLTRRWPHFPSAVSRSAGLCGEQEALLDELLQDELAGLITPQQAIPVAPLTDISPLKRAAILRRWLACCGALMPSRSQLARIWQEVACSREDANPRLVISGGEIRRYAGHLWWVRCFQGQRDTRLDWPDLQVPLILPDNLGQLISAPQGIRLRLPDRATQVSVRFSAAGRLYIVGRDRGRSLKKIWQECGVPPWLRENTPVLFYDDEPVCAPGVFVCQHAQPAESADSQCWFLQWQQEEQSKD